MIVLHDFISSSQLFPTLKRQRSLKASWPLAIGRMTSLEMLLNDIPCVCCVISKSVLAFHRVPLLMCTTFVSLCPRPLIVLSCHPSPSIQIGLVSLGPGPFTADSDCARWFLLFHILPSLIFFSKSFSCFFFFYLALFSFFCCYSLK